ncbi:MAG: hypothetical protein Q8Q35_04615 [Nanoarchaeota archaeon]|nr:hypothetical protein [Nanoarchaeota archaeon]
MKYYRDRSRVVEMKKKTLETIAVESIPFVMGLTLGGVGRVSDFPELVLVSPVMDMVGGVSVYDFRSVVQFGWGYTKYVAGVALPYVDIIYELVR